jgi:hypothetical protein
MELTNHLSRFDFSGEEHLDSWTDRIDVLEQRLDTAERAIAQRRELSASLGVDPCDYLAEDPDVVFQKSSTNSRLNTPRQKLISFKRTSSWPISG